MPSRRIAVLLLLLASAACSGRATPAPSNQPQSSPAAPASAQAMEPAPSALPAGPRTKITGGYTVVSANIGPLWLAAEQGLWQRHGLDVDLTLISGTPIVMAALIAGEIQFANANADAALSVQARNQDVVSFFSASGPPAHRMMVRPDVERVEDLRGKRFGVFTRGDGNEVLISKALVKLGLNPETDATWGGVGGGNFGGLVQALAVGSIDAALLTPPNDLVARRNGARELFRLRDLGLPSAGLPVYTLRRMLDEQRPVAEAYARGFIDGIRLLRADPALAKRTLSEHLSLTDAELLDWSYDYLAADGLVERAYVDVDQLRAILEGLLPEQPDLAQLPLDRVVDHSVMETLDRQGYLAPR